MSRASLDPIVGLCLSSLVAAQSIDGGAVALPDAAHATMPRRLFRDVHELVPGLETAGQSWQADIAAGDVDGDGKVDLVLDAPRAFSGTSPVLWSNLGDGRFRDAAESVDELVSYVPMPLALADLDGDLDLDLVRGTSLFWNVRRGRLALDPAGAPWPRPSCVELVDLDGDLDLDLYGVAAVTQQDILFLNDGVGLFTDASASLPAGAGGADRIAAGDVDGDGDLDVVASGGTSPRLFENDGDAHFGDSSASLPPGASGTGLAFADVDGDLDLDLLSFDALYLNDGAGTFADASDRLPAPLPGGGLALDIDGDGDPDLVRSGLVWRNLGLGFFELVPGALPETPDPEGLLQNADYLLAPGDLDGDGDLDLGTLWRGDLETIPGTVNRYAGDVLLNDGAGTFRSASELDDELPEAPAFHTPITASLHDMDRDGDLDAVVADYFGFLHLLANDGAGRFSDAVVIQSHSSMSVHWIVPADLDGDEDADLLVAGSILRSDSRFLSWFEQDQGTFVGHPILTVHEDFSIQSLATGDVDDDGDVDVLSGADGMLLNDGSGVFARDLTFPFRGTGVALVDVDEDDDLDALIASSPARLALNEAAGWTDASERLSFDSATWIAPGDLDADGDADLVVCGASGIGLHTNDGFGTFAADAILTSDAPVIAALADAEADGDLDVFFGSPYSLGIGLFRNDGQGSFAPSGWSLGAHHPIAPFSGDSYSFHSAFGDTDADGDLDFLTGALWSNLTRQVAWVAPAKLGRTLTLEVCGRPWDPWTLFSSTGTARIQTAFGTWLLDPATTTLAGSGLFDARGRSPFSTDVPPILALVGLSVHWQALVGTPPRLSNRDTTTISGF